MQKVFALLLAELRKLRATIVFADFSRIIIATGKYNMAAAQGYCEYLLKTLKSRYIFHLNPFTVNTVKFRDPFHALLLTSSPYIFLDFFCLINGSWFVYKFFCQ